MDEGVDNAGGGTFAGGLFFVGGHLVNLEPDGIGLMIFDDEGVFGVVVETDDALFTVDAGGVVLLAVVGPADVELADGAAFGAVEAEGVVVHGNAAAVGQGFVNGADHGGHAHDALAQQEVQQVGLVDAEVGQRAKDSALLIVEPAVVGAGPALGAGMTEHGVEAEHAAHLAGGNHAAGFHVGAVEALVVAQHQALAGAAGGLHHGFAFFEGDSHGLFTKHVAACLQRADGNGGVVAVGHAHAYRVRLEGKKLVDAFAHLTAELVGHGLCAVGERIVPANEFAVGVFGIFGRVAYLRDLSAADHSDS